MAISLYRYVKWLHLSPEIRILVEFSSKWISVLQCRTMSLFRSHVSSGQNFFMVIVRFLETFVGSMSAGQHLISILQYYRFKRNIIFFLAFVWTCLRSACVFNVFNVSLDLANKPSCSLIPELKHAATVIKFDAWFIAIQHYISFLSCLMRKMWTFRLKEDWKGSNN